MEGTEAQGPRGLSRGAPEQPQAGPASVVTGRAGWAGTRPLSYPHAELPERALSWPASRGGHTPSLCLDWSGKGASSPPVYMVLQVPEEVGCIEQGRKLDGET